MVWRDSLGNRMPEPAPPPSSNSASEPPLPPSSPNASRSGSRTARGLPFFTAVGSALVMLLLFLAIVLAPFLGATGGAPSSSGLLSFSQARSIADQLLGVDTNQPWNLLDAAGVLSSAGLTIPSSWTVVENTTQGGFSCITVPGPTNLSVPGSNANRSLGLAPVWLLNYGGPSAIAEVAVLDGGAHLLLDYTGPCGSSLGEGFVRTVPPDAIDSTQAAADAAPTVTPYLRLYPNASELTVLSGGFNLSGNPPSPATWSILLTTCVLDSSGPASGSTALVSLNATSGALLSNSTLDHSACPGAPLLPLVLSFGPPATVTSGNLTTVSFGVTSATDGISWANLSAQLQGATGTTVFSGWNLTAVSAVGRAIATYDVATGLWSSGGTQPIAVGDSLVLVAPTSLLSGAVGLQGFLLLNGVGGFGGSITLFL